MNRTLMALTAAALLCVTPAAADEDGMTLEEVLSGHYEAIGGLDAWRSLSSARMLGKMRFPHQDDEAPFAMMLKSPDKLRLEFTVEGMTGIQAVSGDVAWQVMPFMGKPGPEPMPEDQARLMIERADLNGPLVDWRDDGHTVEYLGLEDVEGAPTHKLKVDLASGEVLYLFLDRDALLPVMSSGRATIEGEEIEIETTYGDYKEVGGLMLAHSIEFKQAGAAAGQLLSIETIELNVELSDDRFSMPAGGR